MIKLDLQFRQLRDGLISWRTMGHGLWPLRYWPDAVIENYVLNLQEIADRLPPERDFVFFTHNGRDLIFLIRMILADFYRIAIVKECWVVNEHPVVLLETILFALIGLVYPEEPGELTVEEVLSRQ